MTAEVVEGGIHTDGKGVVPIELRMQTGPLPNLAAPEVVSVEDSTASTADSPAPGCHGLDEVLMEALRVPRDRIFVLQQEKDMEDQIRSGQQDSWELNMMNSYQRLLVHRIADHFGLSHSIDTATKAVTLTKREGSAIPDKSLSVLATAYMERLSEPASAASREGGSFQIMRRQDTGKSEASRNGSGGQFQGQSRRNMTIEEREAAYREARQRIFGSEEATEDNAVEIPSASLSSDVDTKALANLSLNDESSAASTKSNSQKGTSGRASPASTSSSSSAAFLRAGAPSFDPAPRSAPLDGQWHMPPYYQYPGGGFMWPGANGRQVMPGLPPQFPHQTPGSSGSNPDVFSSAGASPSISSRSTSISAGTEGEAGPSSSTRTDVLGTATSQRQMQPPRAQSVSPSVQFSRHGSEHQSSNGYGGGQDFPTALPYAYPNPAMNTPSMNYFAASHMPYGGDRRPLTMPSYALTHVDDGFGRGTGSAAMPPLSSSSSHSSTGAQFTRTDESLNGSLGSQGRGRSDRALYDPNASSSSSHHVGGGVANAYPRIVGDSKGRQALGKSASAAGMLESEFSRTDEGRRQASSTSNIPTVTSSLRRVTPPVHPSLPARPDWVLQHRNRPPSE